MASDLITKGACLFLHEWELSRHQVHLTRRRFAEMSLADLQQRITNASHSLCAWVTAMENRRKLEEIALQAATQAAAMLETSWKNIIQHDGIDADAAQWLLEAEKSRISALTARASAWNGVVPQGANDLQRKQKELAAKITMSGEVVVAFAAWDEAHKVAEHAWQEHNERLQAAAHAAESEEEIPLAPPDTWLSEVRYREVARNHLARQNLAEERLRLASSALEELEAERAACWDEIAGNYTTACAASQLAPPKLKLPSRVGEGIAATEMPEMPTSSGFVLWRCHACSQAPAGLFGFGGGGWQEGATLVLTLSGYLHLFGPASGIANVAKSNETATAASETASSSEEKEEELIEADIRASVYVPLATRCVFLRKGKELTLDLAEAEAAASAAVGATSSSQGASPYAATPSSSAVPSQVAGASSSATSGRGGGLLRWVRRGADAAAPKPRRVQARVADASAFEVLERHCHDLVRRGQGLRRATG